MTLLRRLWTFEPVAVRVGLALVVAAGVLTATQASAVGDVIAALAAVVGAFSARSKVTPTRKVTP